jgi:hypothetical protein
MMRTVARTRAHAQPAGAGTEDDQGSPVGETLIDAEITRGPAPGGDSEDEQETEDGEDQSFALADITASSDESVAASDSSGDQSAAVASAVPAAGEKKPGKKEQERGATFSMTQVNTMPKEIVVPAGKFGACQPSFKFENLKVVIPGDGSKPTIDATLRVICAWGVADLPNNITGADDPQVTKETWRRIANDLEPALEPDGKPTREKYWSRVWSSEHEWFHAGDTFRWAEREAQKLIEKTLANEILYSKEAVEASLARIATKLLNAWVDWFGADMGTEAEKPGEQRCYAQFKNNYQQLAADIRKRGKELEDG